MGSSPDSITQLPISAERYNGSACLNLRSVTAACNLLESEPRNGGTLTRSDLASVLWFVETCVTSNGVFFDGTVPGSIADGATDAVFRLKAKYDLEQFKVTAITFKPKEILGTAAQALAVSRLLLDHFTISPDADMPLKLEDHDKFLSNLKLACSVSEQDRQNLAVQWVSDTFHGSKCLAAMIANGDEVLNSALRLYAQYGDRGPQVSAALINRFRLNYINAIAAKKHGAYIPDPSFESITKEHVRLFKDYLLTRVVQKLPPSETNVLAENMKSETPLPPLGLYALMATKAANRPGAILETAYNQFREDSGLMKLIWKNTKGGIALRKNPDDHYVQEIDEYFYDRYKILEKEAAGIKVPKKGQKARAYLIPALKGLAKAIPEVTGLGKLWDVVASVLRETGTEVSIPYLSERFLGEGCDSYISQYRNLKFEFNEEDSVRVPFAKVADQVMRVFGQKLV